MIGKKKKTYLVKFEVNMNTNHEDKVTVKATKPSIAIKLAEEKLKKEKGYFWLNVRYCVEI